MGHPYSWIESILLLSVPQRHDQRCKLLALQDVLIMTDFSHQLVAQLLSYPLGTAWARFVPKVKVFGISINPGQFTVKEHVLITVMGTVGATSAYATDIIAVQRVFYNQNYNFSYQWMVVMSTQLIGFSIGGVARRFLVSPPSMSTHRLLPPGADFIHIISLSLACELGSLRPIQHTPCARIRRRR